MRIKSPGEGDFQKLHMETPTKTTTKLTSLSSTLDLEPKASSRLVHLGHSCNIHPDFDKIDRGQHLNLLFKWNS